jgi:hypothetical protein
MPRVMTNEGTEIDLTMEPVGSIWESDGGWIVWVPGLGGVWSETRAGAIEAMDLWLEEPTSKGHR